MTGKQQAFVTELLTNPKISATEAASRTYNVKSRDVARSIGAENLAKPSIMAVLAKHDLDAQKVLADALKARKKLFQYDKDAGGVVQVGEEDDHAIRLRAADSILDRVHGKATQRTENVTVSLTFGMDLSGTISQD